MKSLDVLATWAEQQSSRELAMLRLGIAYHMLKTGQHRLTLSLPALSELISQHIATVSVEPDKSLTFTLEPRDAVPLDGPLTPD